MNQSSVKRRVDGRCLQWRDFWSRLAAFIRPIPKQGWRRHHLVLRRSLSAGCCVVVVVSGVSVSSGCVCYSLVLGGSVVAAGNLAAVRGLIGLMDFGNCGEPCGSKTGTFPGDLTLQDASNRHKNPSNTLYKPMLSKQTPCTVTKCIQCREYDTVARVPDAF